MNIFYKTLASAILLAAVASAQYNYPKPDPPRGSYLPPDDAPAPTTRAPPAYRPPEQDTKIDSEAINPPSSGGQNSGDSGHHDSDHHEPGMPYDFSYAVKDDNGNDFSHMAESDGDVVKGEYRTLLPDGRLQIVKYTADWKNGYNAEVTYEGEAKYPEPEEKPAAAPAPARTPAPSRQPQPTQRPSNNFRPESETDIDSQGLSPSRPQQPPRQQRPQQQPTQRPQAPGGLYGAPEVPFGVRMNPKFGYTRK